MVHSGNEKHVKLASDLLHNTDPPLQVSVSVLPMVNSGNEKHVKVASDLLDLNFVQENISDNLGLNDSDKVLANENENTEQGISIDNTR